MQVRVQRAVSALALLAAGLLVPAASGLVCQQCVDIPDDMNNTYVRQAASVVASLTAGTGGIANDTRCSDPHHPGTPHPAARVCENAAAAACANITKREIVIRLCALETPHSGCRSAAGTTVCLCTEDDCNGGHQTGGGAGSPSPPALALLLAALATAAPALR